MKDKANEVVKKSKLDKFLKEATDRELQEGIYTFLKTNNNYNKHYEKQFNVLVFWTQFWSWIVIIAFIIGFVYLAFTQ